MSTQTTTVAGSPAGALIQYGSTTGASQYNLTQLGSANTSYAQVTATNAGDMLSAVNAALQAVKTYASQIGASQNAMTAASNFNAALNTNVANGIGALVDADMNQASTSPAGSADPAAARHPVAVDRQPEQPAHPEAVRLIFPAGSAPRQLRGAQATCAPLFFDYPAALIGAPLLACRAARVTPSAIQRRTKPSRVTSSTARSV